MPKRCSKSSNATSPILPFEILSGRNGVEAAGADAPEPVAEECYDLCGRRLMAGAASRPAVYIRLLRYADGSVKRLKVRNVK